MSHDSQPAIDAPALAPPESDVQMSPIERAHARVGHAVRGKWRLESLLSAGATSAVYAATHRNRNRGAVKMLHAELSARPQSKVIDGKIHAHVTLANPDKAFGGHLEAGTTVFTFAIVTLGVLDASADLSRMDDKTYR